MEVHLKKCGITAMDMRTGQQVATDNIPLHGQPFPVILPNQSQKHLGLRMTMDGYFSVPFFQKRGDCDGWRPWQKTVLSRREKDLVIETAVYSVFCYGADLVDWTRAELYNNSKM
jgi:hypothetical protein